MSDLRCPYCHSGNDVCHDDGEHCEEDRTHQMECRGCEKLFTFTTSMTFYYKPEKADCLNDGEHDWKPSHTYPNFMTTMICSTCNNMRQPTDLEKHKHNIPEYKQGDY